jgi:anti-sigma B factor antagonist
MRDEPLAIETAPVSRADAAVLRLKGPLTLSTLFALQDALRAQNVHLTILDLSGVPYIDSAGLGTILISYVSAEKNGRKLVLVGVSERVQSLIRMTRVDTVLKTFPTVEDAERSL